MTQETEEEKAKQPRMGPQDTDERKGFFAARGGPRKIVCAKFVDKTEFTSPTPKKEEKPKSKLGQMFSDLAELKKKKHMETANVHGLYTIEQKIMQVEEQNKVSLLEKI